MVKNPPANAEDTGSTPGSGRSPGEGNGNTLQYSCLENPMDGRAWWATLHGVAKKSDPTECLNNNKPDPSQGKLVELSLFKIHYSSSSLWCPK